MRILYVEDNEVNRALVERVMRARRCSVVFQDEGEGALDVLANDATIDLILLDIELAGTMTGLDVIKALRARNDHRPVVAVTAYAMMGDRERILEAGCDQYLPKPLVVTDLLNMIDHYQDELAAKAEQPPAALAATPAAPTPAPAAEAPTPATPAAPTPAPAAEVPTPATPTAETLAPPVPAPAPITTAQTPVVTQIVTEPAEAKPETKPAETAKAPAGEASAEAKDKTTPAEAAPSSETPSTAAPEVAQKADQELPVEDSL